MRKILLFIVPLISIAMVYHFNQGLQKQTEVLQEWDNKAEQLNSLGTLTQNYFMMRIETLQLISPLSTAEVKILSEHNRSNFIYEASKNFLALEQRAGTNEEKLLLKDMLGKLGAMREVMEKATVQNAQKSIEDMVQKRVPYREAAANYAAYLGKMRNKAKDEMITAQKEMQNQIKILFALQLAGVAVGLIYVRSVRS